MRNVFYWLWGVVALFVLGLALVFTAAFTTQTVRFAGTADVELQFISTQFDKAITPALTDESHSPIAVGREGIAHVPAKFETRDANIFDTWGGGPHPRTAIVSFFEDATKHHEVLFRFDRHLKVWQAEVAFPDPTIADVQVEESDLRFEKSDGDQRVYSSKIRAKVLVGPPIIRND